MATGRAVVRVLPRRCSPTHRRRQVLHGGDDHGGLAFLGVAEPLHERGADEHTRRARTPFWARRRCPAAVGELDRSIQRRVAGHATFIVLEQREHRVRGLHLLTTSPVGRRDWPARRLATSLHAPGVGARPPAVSI